MFCTPARKDASPPGSRISPHSSLKVGPALLSVRRSIGEGEARKTEPQGKSSAFSKRDSNSSEHSGDASVAWSRRNSAAETGIKVPQPHSGGVSLPEQGKASFGQLSQHKDWGTEEINRLFELVKESERNRTPIVSAPVIATAVEIEVVEPTIEEPMELMHSLMLGLKKHKKALEECKQYTQALSVQIQQTPCRHP